MSNPDLKEQYIINYYIYTLYTRYDLCAVITHRNYAYNIYRDLVLQFEDNPSNFTIYDSDMSSTINGTSYNIDDIMNSNNITISSNNVSETDKVITIIDNINNELIEITFENGNVSLVKMDQETIKYTYKENKIIARLEDHAREKDEYYRPATDIVKIDSDDRFVINFEVTEYLESRISDTELIFTHSSSYCSYLDLTSNNKKWVHVDIEIIKKFNRLLKYVVDQEDRLEFNDDIIDDSDSMGDLSDLPEELLSE